MIKQLLTALAPIACVAFALVLIVGPTFANAAATLNGAF